MRPRGSACPSCPQDFSKEHIPLEDKRERAGPQKAQARKSQALELGLEEAQRPFFIGPSRDLPGGGIASLPASHAASLHSLVLLSPQAVPKARASGSGRGRLSHSASSIVMFVIVCCYHRPERPVSIYYPPGTMLRSHLDELPQFSQQHSVKYTSDIPIY